MVAILRCFGIFFLLLGTMITANGNDLIIGDVHIARFSTEDFCRLISYFSSKEPAPRHTLIRTDAAEKEGTYFILFFNKRLNFPVEDGEVILSYCIASDSKLYTLRLPLQSIVPHSKELWIGLTDAEWCHHLPQEFLAWKVELWNEGKVIAEKRSFLFPEREKRTPLRRGNL